MHHPTITPAERERQQLQEELAEQFWPAILGELAGPMAHEFNNFLNTVLLEISVLQMEIPATARAELGIIQKHAANAAQLIKQLQQYRQRREGEPRPVDVNSIVREVATTWNAGTTERGLGPGITPPNLILDLGSDVPAVLALPAAVKRLIFLLLKNATSAQRDSRNPIIIRSRRSASAVALSVEDPGSSILPENLGQMFDLGPAREGVSSLELAACKSIVRRLEGKIHGSNRPQGGVAVVVELPAAG